MSLQTYFNDTALTLIRSLVTGGATPELELMLAEGAGVQGRSLWQADELMKHRDRCRIAHMPVATGFFRDIQVHVCMSK
jgi:hypothetical protein